MNHQPNDTFTILCYSDAQTIWMFMIDILMFGLVVSQLYANDKNIVLFVAWKVLFYYMMLLCLFH